MNALVLDNGTVLRVNDLDELFINSSFHFKPEVWKTFSTIPLTENFTQQLEPLTEVSVVRFESTVHVTFLKHLEQQYPENYRGAVPDTPYRALVQLNVKQWSAVLRFLQVLQHPLFRLITA